MAVTKAYHFEVVFAKDGAKVQSLGDELEGKRISVWYDRGLIAGEEYRDVLRQRIETVKVVVVLWTENSILSLWVKAEAELADGHNKLIACAIRRSRRHLCHAAAREVVQLDGDRRSSAGPAARQVDRTEWRRRRRHYLSCPHQRL